MEAAHAILLVYFRLALLVINTNECVCVCVWNMLKLIRYHSRHSGQGVKWIRNKLRFQNVYLVS